MCCVLECTRSGGEEVLQGFHSEAFRQIDLQRGRYVVQPFLSVTTVVLNGPNNYRIVTRQLKYSTLLNVSHGREFLLHIHYFSCRNGGALLAHI